MDKTLQYKFLSEYYRDEDITKHDYYQKKYKQNLEKYVENLGTHDVSVKKPKKPNVQFGRIRVLHAATNANVPVDIYINGQPAIRNLAFGAITGYTSLPVGDYKIEVFPAGKRDKAVITQYVRVNKGRAYTLAAADVRGTKNNQLLVYEDDLTPVAGRSRVRLIHLSPDLGRVDVAIKGGNVIFSDVGYRDARFITLDSGRYNLEIRPVGKKEILFDVPDVRLVAGKIYTIMVIGRTEGQPPFQVLMVEDRK